MCPCWHNSQLIVSAVSGSEPPSSGPYDVSMLTQFTVDRVQALEQVVSRWQGPLHALLYADDRDANKLFKVFSASNILSSRKNIAFHVVYKRRVSIRAYSSSIGYKQTPSMQYSILKDADTMTVARH